MNNYEQYKFYLDVLVMVLLPLVSFLVGMTLNKLAKISTALDVQTASIFRKIDEIDKKIDERDERMRAEFNARFQEERQLVYRLLDAMKVGVRSGN